VNNQAPEQPWHREKRPYKAGGLGKRELEQVPDRQHEFHCLI
jgi:hypothetical protein